MININFPNYQTRSINNALLDLEDLHEKDIQNNIKEESSFTVLSLHEASPDYIEKFKNHEDVDFLDFLEKSSKCQDAIINKFYNSFNENINIENIQSITDNLSEILDRFENNIVFGDRKKFSYYYSLLEQSQNYFSGQGSNFGYAIDKLNITNADLTEFIKSNIVKDNFKEFYTNCLGFNNSNDTLVNEVNSLRGIDENEVFTVAENTAVLSLVQLLNVSLNDGNNKSLTHGTGLFNAITSHDNNNFLTFNKRDSSKINIVIGQDFNEKIHLNYFNTNNSANSFEGVDFNRVVYERFLDKVYSSKILFTEMNYIPALFNGDNTQNRNNSFISYDVISQNVSDNYKIFMKALLKTNYAISALGIKGTDKNFVEFRKQNYRTFITNSNIEINNILFGFDNDQIYGNLSYYTQALKKKISNSRKNLFKLNKNKILSSNLLKTIDEKTNTNEKIINSLGITHQTIRRSIVSRELEGSIKDLFVYNDVDIFESNNQLTSKNGFNYFTVGNTEQLQNVVDIHQEELASVEETIDAYFDIQISNTDLFKDLTDHATKGVKNSLTRLNENIQHEYGNLPVHLLEEIAFISRFTGNKNYELEELIQNQELFKNIMAEILYYSVNNIAQINIVKDAIPNNIIEKLDIENLNAATLETIAQNIINVNYGNEEIFEKRMSGDGALIKRENLFLSLESEQFENDFRRYAKDLNSAERNSNSFRISPRYFTLCGIPIPDIYSSNREKIKKTYDEHSFFEFFDIKDKDRISFGCKLIYKPFIGFISKGGLSNDDYSEVNSYHLINKNRGILAQLSQDVTGIIASYVDFLKIYLTKSEIFEGDLNNLSANVKEYTLNFIKESFEAYCYLVVAQLSQTFEYSSTLNAIKLFSETPIDFTKGLFPGGDLYVTSDLQKERYITSWIIDDNGTRRNNEWGRSSDYSSLSKWCFPDHNHDEIKKFVCFINYFDKSNYLERKEGWRGRDNQKSSLPASIENILKTLYFRNDNAKQNFLNYFQSIEFTDDIIKQSDPNFEFQRASDTKFTGGVFFKEIFTYKSIKLLNEGINERENNKNKYVDDLIEEANQFLYSRNKYLNNRAIEDVGDGIDGTNTYVSYWSQYNTDYPLIHKNNFISNMHLGFVSKAYEDIVARINNNLFFKSSVEENKDAIFNTLNKVYSGLFAEDFSISYLFDSYHYAFSHFKRYKEFLELTGEVDEEIDEEDETVEESIVEFSNLVSRHYDDPSLFEFSDYISKINEIQNAQIRFNSLEKQKQYDYLTNNITRLANGKNHYNDAKNFFNFYIKSALDDSKGKKRILCVGLKDNIAASNNNIITVTVNKFDSIIKEYSNDLKFKFNMNYFVPESNGRESNLFDYKVLNYNQTTKNFEEVIESNQIVNNHRKSFLAKKYLQAISGYGVDENSLRLSLDNVTALKSETPRVITRRAEFINEKLLELNDDYAEMSEVSQNLLNDEGEFSSLRDNIDYNVENDVYTNIIDTNIKNKQDIYKRLIQFDYNYFSNESLGEIYMPKEFTKVFYILLSEKSFNFATNSSRQSNNYSLKVSINIE